MFFERNCPVCERPARQLCLPCRAHLDRVSNDDCLAAQEHGSLGLDTFSVGFHYDEVSKRLVLAAKNGGRRDLFAFIARQLVSVIPPELASAVDVVTWVPASSEHRRGRGFDQGRLLGRALGRRLGVPALRMLAREGESQKGLTRSQRLAGPRMEAVRSSPHSVLLVDDVCTTGSSLRGAAAALRRSGAVEVHGLVVALVLSPNQAQAGELI